MSTGVRQEDIEFDAGGVTLRGWLFLPDEAKMPSPGVVMAHGFGGVKEMTLDRFAQVFASSGLAVVVYDHPSWGSSEGKPRQEIDPWVQIEGYKHAITFAQSRKEIDPEQIGVWGTSYSGGHVLVVAAEDARVRCVVSQLPYIWPLIPEPPEQLRRLIEKDRSVRESGGSPLVIPLVGTDPSRAVIQDPEAWEVFTELAKNAPLWRNEVTVKSLELWFSYRPGDYIQKVAPIPLLMIVQEEDFVAPSPLAISAFESAAEPKKLVTLPGRHFDAYGKNFDQTSSQAANWFVKHLIPG